MIGISLRVSSANSLNHALARANRGNTSTSIIYIWYIRTLVGREKLNIGDSEVVRNGQLSSQPFRYHEISEAEDGVERETYHSNPPEPELRESFSAKVVGGGSRSLNTALMCSP